MGDFTVAALGPTTWDAFAELVERHNGVWGGCWCTWFHAEKVPDGGGPAGARDLKRQLVLDGRAHAALVFDGDEAVAWCQFGPPCELPNIYHRKEYEAAADVVPDYRLTCLFVGKGYRRKGIAAVAVRGALELIADAGGGTVEAYPQDTQGRKLSASLLYNGTRGLFESLGFDYVRQKGKGHTVMRTFVPASVRRPR